MLAKITRLDRILVDLDFGLVAKVADCKEQCIYDFNHAIGTIIQGVSNPEKNLPGLFGTSLAIVPCSGATP